MYLCMCVYFCVPFCCNTTATAPHAHTHTHPHTHVMQIRRNHQRSHALRVLLQNDCRSIHTHTHTQTHSYIHTYIHTYVMQIRRSHQSAQVLPPLQKDCIIHTYIHTHIVQIRRSNQCAQALCFASNRLRQPCRRIRLSQSACHRVYTHRRPVQCQGVTQPGSRRKSAAGNTCIHVHVHVCMYVCMYVCVYKFTISLPSHTHALATSSMPRSHSARVSEEVSCR
jgi:hypothetical protein